MYYNLLWYFCSSHIRGKSAYVYIRDVLGSHLIIYLIIIIRKIEGAKILNYSYFTMFFFYVDAYKY